jgi:hypothetical protein
MDIKLACTVARRYSAMRLLHIASALSSVSLALAWTTYVVPNSPGNDDTPALAAAFSADPKLATNATILFKRGVTYNISTPIRFPRFENVIVSVQGNLTYADDIKATQGANPRTARREFLTLTPGVHFSSDRRVFGGSRCFPLGFLHALNILFCTEFPRKLVSSRPFLPNDDFNSTFPRFTFTGGTNVTLEGSRDPQWGWVDSHGQQVGEKLLIAGGRVLIRVCQWWDVMQELASQVNRPHGWAFQNIVNGEIKYMKLWQVSVAMARPVLQSDLIPVPFSP